MISIGENIRTLRKKAGLTQKQLAERAEVNEVTIRSYEAGKYVPKIETLKKIAASLNCEISDIDESIYIIPSYKPTTERMEWFKLEAEATQIYEKAQTGKALTSEEQQKIIDYEKQLKSQAERRDKAAKKAPKFTAYDENGNEIKDGKPPKFTDLSMSKEEAIAAAESEELERIQVAYKRLNRKGKAKAVERVEELTEIPRYTKEDPPIDPFFMLSKKKRKR